MKIKGVPLMGLNVQEIIIPRGDGMPIVFFARALPDFSEFDKLVPQPEPPRRLMAGGIEVQNIADPHHQVALAIRSDMRMDFMVLKSLEATPDLEWELVKITDPTTWQYLRQEFRNSGFTDIEIGRIRAGCMKANCLNEDHIQEAANRFHVARQAFPQEKSPMDVPTSTQFGEPAKDSESNPQA